MGMVFEIVAGRRDIPIAVEASQHARVFSEAAESAYCQLDDEDRKMISSIVFDLAHTKRIRNFGDAAARELLMVIGILMTTLSDEEFEKLQKQVKRRNHEKE